MAPLHQLTAITLALASAAQAAVVPSRVELKVRAVSTSPAATGSQTASSSLTLSFSPSARPTEGITVTSTRDVHATTETYTPLLPALFNLASSLGWIPLSIMATNQTACPAELAMPAPPTYTGLATQVLDNHPYGGCCFGAVVADYSGFVQPANVSTILSSNQHIGCFATLSDQTNSPPYGAAQSFVDEYASSRPYPIATTTTVVDSEEKRSGATRTSSLDVSSFMVLFTAFTAVVGGAAVLL